MSADTELAVVKRELALYGIKPEVETTGGNHIKVSWQIAGKARRSMTVANTGSDWRGPLNERANVRRLLREDNVQLAIARETNGNGHAHPKPAATPLLHQAIAVPVETVPLPKQIEALRAEAADLTDAVVAMMAQVDDIQRTVQGMWDALGSDIGEIMAMLKPAPAPAPAPAPIAAPAAAPRKRGRPLGSKNKPKQPTASGPAARAPTKQAAARRPRRGRWKQWQ